MHGLIHVIHRKSRKIRGLHSTKNEQLFCAEIIKLVDLWKNVGKLLDRFMTTGCYFLELKNLSSSAILQKTIFGHKGNYGEAFTTIGNEYSE